MPGPFDVTDPDALRSATFGKVLRGFDRAEVSAVLHAVAVHIEALQRSRRELEEEVRSLRAELEAATEAAQRPSLESLDRAELESLLGVEMLQVLDSARAAAEQRRAEAEDAYAARVKEAEEEVERIRSGVADIVGERRAEAEAEAEEILAAARADAARILQEAESEAARRLVEAESEAAQQRQAALAELDELGDGAESVIARARMESRELINEAERARAAILSDLLSRRQQLRHQIEQLRAGRDRMLRAFLVVRQGVDSAIRQVETSLPEARAAAEAVLPPLPDMSLDDLESEIEAARVLGLNAYGHTGAEGGGQRSEEPEREEPAAAATDAVALDSPDTPAVVILGPAGESSATGAATEAEEGDAEPEEGAPQREATPPEPEPTDDEEEAAILLRELGRRHGGLFRRKPPPGIERLPVEKVPTVEPVAEFEEVRVVRDTPAGDGEEAAAEQPAPPDEEAGTEAPAETEPEPVDAAAVEPEPEPEAEEAVAEPETEPEPEDGPELAETEPGEEPESEPEPVEAVSEPEEEPEAEPEEEPEPVEAVAEPEEEPEPEPPATKPLSKEVDDLFARIRAAREAAVAEARAVLDEGSTEAPEPEEAADAREAEPEQEDEDDEPQPAPAEPDPVEPPARLQPPGRGARLDGALRWLEDVEPAPDLEELAPAAAPVADSDPHERRDALLAPVIRDLGRAVKRALADELNLALGAVRESEGLLDVDGALGGILEQRDRYAEVLMEPLRRAVQVGAELAGGSVAAPDAAAAKGLDLLAEELLGVLRSRASRILSDAAGEPDEIQDRMRALYRELRQQRAEPAATHAARHASGAGAAAVLAPGTLVRWVMAPGQPCSPDCEDNALSGELAFGEPFPTGDLHPPRHPGCRCMLVEAHR